MATFVMLTRLSGESLHQPRSFESLERHVVEQVRMQVSAVVRSYAHAQTEVWPAVQWSEFKKLVHGLPAAA